MGRLASELSSRGQRFFRIRPPHESVCPSAGDGGSGCAHTPQAAKVARFSCEASRYPCCSSIRPVSVTATFCDLDDGRRKPTLPLGQLWIGQFINPKRGLIFEQNAPNTNIYSSIRQECFRIDLCDSGAATGRKKSLSPSGKESTEKTHRQADCCFRREY